MVEPNAIPLRARVFRTAFVTATAWTFGVLWLGWAALEVYDNTEWWPGWTYRPAHYAYYLLQQTYAPLVGMLALVWAPFVLAPIGWRRWLVGAIAVALAATWQFHVFPDVRE
jgi:hypothetical protein